MAKIFCKHFISTTFPLSNGKRVVIHGTNKHTMELPKGTPFCNSVDDTDWINVLREYQETGRAPHLFGDEFNEPLIFEADKESVAFEVANDSPDVVPNKYAQGSDTTLTPSKPVKKRARVE